MNPATLALGVQTTIVGLGVVFIMLTVLWGVVTRMDNIVDSMSQKQPPAGGSGGGSRTPAPAPAAAPAAKAESGASSAKTVAVIMGAISAITGTPLSELRFTAIQREGGPRLAWSEAGITEMINIRQQFL
jgi:sodium pump decarboxylase gamma subunit